MTAYSCTKRNGYRTLLLYIMIATQPKNDLDLHGRSQSRGVLPPRRRPGSGITHSAPKYSFGPVPSFRLTLPKQWRYLTVLMLALLLATVTFESHSLATLNVDRSGSQNGLEESALSSSSGTVKAAMIDLQLPEIRNVALPPMPVRKDEVRQPHLAASNVILIDNESKTVLYDKNVAKRISIASTTKIMTALVAMELFGDELDKPIKISPRAMAQIGSVVGFRQGENATMRQLLNGLLIVSGNDAALVISESLPVSVGREATDAFVERMNAMAKKFGMNDTYFRDPAGLDDDGYSTAADMAKAMSELLKYPDLMTIISTLDYEYRSPEGYLHTFKSSNRLLGEMFYAGTLGGKTGFTPRTTEGGAGHCLIAAAKRDGHTLIAGVFDTHSNTPQASAEVARAAFEYGFSGFRWENFSR